MGRNKIGSNIGSPIGTRPGSIIALVALWLVIGAWTSQSAAGSVLWVSRDDSSLVSTATAEGRLVVFDDVWETIQERYYDPKFHGVDWQAKRDLFRPAA
ncbi:MAG TPA: hypothetical protein VKA97_01370, partial [Pyrinomonadaceae bacterium]|nr:hypothetical protein [Pyrinomonadaceae bacterium]